MRKAILAGAAAAALAGGVHAAPVLYECALSTRDPGVDWISQSYGFVIEEGAATVVDSIALRFAGAPVQARSSASGAGLRLTWTIPVRDAGQNTAQMRYRADLDTQARRAIVQARPLGYRKAWQGAGACTARRQ